MRGFLVILVCLTVACKSGEKGKELPELKLMMTDAHGGTEESGLEIIRSEGALKKYFARINRTRKPGIPVPQIDFSTYMALVYCSGRTTDTILPSLRVVSEEAEKIVLGTREPKVVRDSLQTAQRLPFALYLLPYSEKEIIME